MNLYIKIPISRAFGDLLEMDFADDGDEATFPSYKIHLPDIRRSPVYGRKGKRGKLTQKRRKLRYRRGLVFMSGRHMISY